MSWQHKRTMTADEYSTLLKRLRLTKSAAARYLGVSASTQRRYACGSKAIPVATVLLLRAIVAHNVRPEVPTRDPNAWD